jgi:hypothetical protein
MAGLKQSSDLDGGGCFQSTLHFFMIINADSSAAMLVDHYRAEDDQKFDRKESEFPQEVSR